MVHKVLLAVLAQEVILNLSGRGGPFKVVEGLGRLNLRPTYARI